MELQRKIEDAKEQSNIVQPDINRLNTHSLSNKNETKSVEEAIDESNYRSKGLRWIYISLISLAVLLIFWFIYRLVVARITNNAASLEGFSPQELLLGLIRKFLYYAIFIHIVFIVLKLRFANKNKTALDEKADSKIAFSNKKNLAWGYIVTNIIIFWLVSFAILFYISVTFYHTPNYNKIINNCVPGKDPGICALDQTIEN